MVPGSICLYNFAYTRMLDSLVSMVLADKSTIVFLLRSCSGHQTWGTITPLGIFSLNNPACTDGKALCGAWISNPIRKWFRMAQWTCTAFLHSPQVTHEPFFILQRKQAWPCRAGCTAPTYSTGCRVSAFTNLHSGINWAHVA